MAPAPGSTADAPKRPGPLPEALPRLGELHPAGLLLLAVAVLAAWPLFRYGIGGLATAWAKPEFSHGPVIPVLSFWMFLRELKAVPPVPGPVRDRWPGVALVALALGLALLGNLARLDNLICYALILWIGGLVLVGFGWARGRLFWPSVLHLVFMLPLPQVLYWEVTTALQLVSSQIGVGLVRLAGVPVYLEGNVIDLGVWKLMVAEACSGLRYLFPIMSFTYVFAVLYRGPVVVKAALLLAAIPIAVLMNALRIGVIGLLVDRYGIAQAEGFLHAFEGWVVFLGCLVLLLGLAKLVQRLAGDRRRLGEALALDFSGLGAQAARIGGVVPSPALAATALLTAGLSAAFLLLPARGPGAVPAREPFVLFPRELGAWTGQPTTLDPAIVRGLKADDQFAAVFRRPGEATGVDLFLSFYADQTQDKAIHSPSVCLPGAGWEVAEIARTTLAVPLLSGTTRSLTLNRAVIQRGLDRQLVYYWFAGRGRQVTGDIEAKLLLFADSLTEGRSDGGLVRLVTPILPEAGGLPAAEDRLQGFLAASLDRLPAFIPD